MASAISSLPGSRPARSQLKAELQEGHKSIDFRKKRLFTNVRGALSGLPASRDFMKPGHFISLM
jgi:hypothetical protein